MNRLSAPVMLFAHDMFFESDSNDDHEESGEEKNIFGVAVRFGVSKSTAWAAVLRICKAVIDLNRRYGLIKWPSRQRCFTISRNFEEKHHIPGIIGAIDGSHIKIVAPKQYPNSYINRKGYHSMVLQSICDHQKLFTDVYVGEAGSVHDYTVFFKSDMSKRPLEDFPNDTHLIGDLVYRLTKTLLVGFKDNGYLTDRQKNFNKTLSKARVIIENAFALLKGRFRRLKYMETIILENTVTIILTASILHNICILNDDEFHDIGNLNEEILGERLRNPRNERDINVPEENRQAQLKRSEIVNVLLLRNL
ncbi:hypothetical protein NQ314_020078 [Rhamnusium bicolor]|uniref:DDE Tnp4 domain-containing protein n=1 Tax=Rhamnusium bicolor TaxID=1586634 RepID=A0AAV8WL46_9CUCU|nr:hypothetical protein NQ314_020078 [Rhamnusium bicolor]